MLADARKSTFRLLLDSVRPRQWVKNLFVFAPLIFAERLWDLVALQHSALAFVCFCCLSAATYLANDIRDRNQDRNHPSKKHRPIASGQLSLAIAGVCAIGLHAAAIALAWSLGFPFVWTAAAYIMLQFFYALVAKQIVILDVFCIATGFVLRVLGGATAVPVPASAWLILCTLLIALFLALAKRRHELVLLGNDASQYRSNLAHYSADLLDQLINIVAAATVISYALYTMDPATQQRVGSHGLIYTVPFVLYGIFRYLYLIHKEDAGGEPERTLVTDVHMIVTVLAYGASVVWLMYSF